MKAVECSGLTKCYKEKKALSSLSFSVEKGEIFGLLGTNGAGKTTCIKILSGLTNPTSGDAFVFGDSVTTSPEKTKKAISISPQESAYAANLSVFENLVFSAGLYGADEKSAFLSAEEMIADFELAEYKNTRASKLSGGCQRRLSLAMALISNPEIVFLDEPTLGLDVIARRALWKKIEGLRGKKTVILTTHYLEEASALCDRILIIRDGENRICGTAREITEKSGKDSFEEAFIHFAAGGDEE